MILVAAPANEECGGGTILSGEGVIVVRDNSWVRETFQWRPLCGDEECGKGFLVVVCLGYFVMRSVVW